MQTNEINIVLTENDKLILESYRIMIRGLGLYLGEGYEIILHSLENIEHSVIEIVNGYHTGRTTGAPITDYALQMLKNLQEHDGLSGISYYIKNASNKTIKSCTIPVVGEHERIIGLCCMNFYCDIPLDAFLANFFPSVAENESIPPVTENFFRDSDDLILSSVTEIRKEVFDDQAISSSNKNREIVIRLDEMGIFNIKDAILKVAEILQISKNTVYMHIRNGKKN